MDWNAGGPISVGYGDEDAPVYDPGEVHRLIDATLRDIERLPAETARKLAAIEPGAPPVGRIWPPTVDERLKRQQERADALQAKWTAQHVAPGHRTVSCGRMCHTTPCAACPERWPADSIEHRVAEHIQRVNEPKGPLGLRWRLWWMRRRLWLVRARLDGGPPRAARRAIWWALVLTAIGQTGAVLLGSPPPSVFAWVVVVPCEIVAVATIRWCGLGGWRTPTVDRALKES